MSQSVRKVDYFHVMVPNKPGRGGRVLAGLAAEGVNLLAFSGYPPFKDIVSSVALTFFAFLGFGVITFTAKDLADPARQLPRAIYLALGIATTIYVAVALGVFGVLVHLGKRVGAAQKQRADQGQQQVGFL